VKKNGVFREKNNTVKELFNTSKAVIGVIHSKALPGSPGYQGESIQEIYDFALDEALKYQKGGVDGLIVENHGDIPFSKPNDIGPESVAAMSVMSHYVRKNTSLPVGINFLANAAIPALSVAKASQSRFIRINQWANAYVANEGFIEGDAARATRFRSWIRANDIKIFADVHVKHGAHAIVSDRSVSEMARDAEFFDADVLIVTGQRTGDSAQLDEVKEIASGSQLPVVIGSGVNIDNAEELFSVAQGVIVASSLKEDGVWWSPVSVSKVKKFTETVKKLR
jgi:uncharacterized protein